MKVILPITYQCIQCSDINRLKDPFSSCEDSKPNDETKFPILIVIIGLIILVIVAIGIIISYVLYLEKGENQTSDMLS